MEAVASLLRGAWEWFQALDLCSSAADRARARVRLQLEEELAKPAGQRNERRLLALRKADNSLHWGYYAVRAGKHCGCGPRSQCTARSGVAALGPPLPACTIAQGCLVPPLTSASRSCVTLGVYTPNNARASPKRATAAAAARPAPECWGERPRRTERLPPSTVG
jgi:hypothetical protein